MMPLARPKPRLDTENRAFWSGGAQGRLQIMRCGDCATFEQQDEIYYPLFEKAD